MSESQRLLLQQIRTSTDRVRRIFCENVEIARLCLHYGLNQSLVVEMFNLASIESPEMIELIITAAQEWRHNGHPRDRRHGHPFWCGPNNCPGADNCICACHSQPVAAVCS